MIPKLTDDAIAELPLQHGRADLLEEIMRTPVLDDRPARTDPARRTWLAPVAAAAAIAVLALGAWWTTRADEQPAIDDTPVATAPEGSELAVLDAPGWEISNAYGDRYGGELFYAKGDRSFEISWYPEDQYESYVEDRRHIGTRPQDGEPIEVLSEPALTWPYSALNHTAIRVPVAGWTLEFRGDGMDEAAYRELLGQLRSVDEDGFEAAMPESFVPSAERDAEIDEVVAGIEQHVDPLLPPEGTRARVGSDQVDPYHLGVDVAGQVACAWLDDLREATATGDTERAQAARDVLGTVREWPVLQEMEAKGDYPRVLWRYADQAVAGEVPAGYAEGLGCEG